MAEPVKSIPCPECDSLDVRRAYPKGVVTAIMSMRGYTALRCRRCSYRFYRKLLPGDVLGLPELPEDTPAGPHPADIYPPLAKPLNGEKH